MSAETVISWGHGQVLGRLKGIFAGKAITVTAMLDSTCF